jgi:uncharacterized secreted protein with C-terminal beta-propeller domain
MKKFIMLFIAIFSSIVIISCSQKTTTEKITPTGDNVGAFSSYEQLKDYLGDFYEYSNNRYYLFGDAALESGAPEVNAPTNDSVDFGDQEERDHSTSNDQVEGVNEADTILTDGYFIYIVSGNKFFMIDAETLEITYTYEYPDGYFSGLYLYEDKVVLLGNYYAYIDLTVAEDPTVDPTVDSDESKEDYWYPIYYYRYVYGTMITVLDVSNPDNVEVARELKFDSSYLTTSRMIDGYLYLVLNNYSISYYYDEETFIPKYYDSVVSDEMIDLPASSIYFIPNNAEDFSYLMLASFDVTDNDDAKVKAYLGSTYQTYMSADNLYATVYKYQYIEQTNTYENYVFILRFELEDHELSYKALGQVDGSPLNQFSMDEYDGVFRIAVTGYEYTNQETIITNTLYLLDATSDNEMTEISKLTGLGKPGERIYAVRFSEEIAYVVTFVSIDPLYKLDLSDPQNPEILGEWYEEGVSDYLHEITDNLMIGVGRQVENDEYGWTRFTGVKIALYDTSADTVVNLETYFVEGEYSYSSVGWNHKAFIYFTPEGEDFTYIAIPISVYSENYYRYSQMMYVFKVHHSGDLELVAQLQHTDEVNNYFDTIEKAVMIENYIYTLSYSQIQVFNMDDEFNFVDSVVFNELYYHDYNYTEEPIASEVDGDVVTEPVE